MKRIVNSLVLTFGVAAAFVAGPALAQQGGDALLLTDLTAEQLEALKSVLSGLPRQ